MSELNESEDAYSDADVSGSSGSSLDFSSPQLSKEASEYSGMNNPQPRSLTKLFEESALDSDEERELRLLVSSSLYVDEGDGEHYVEDVVSKETSSNDDDSVDNIDVSIDTATAQAMDNAITAALNATYEIPQEPDGRHEACVQSIPKVRNRFSNSIEQSASAYSDMEDSDGSADADIDTTSALSSSNVSNFHTTNKDTGQHTPQPGIFTSEFTVHFSTNKDGNVPRIAIPGEGEYSDMSSLDSEEEGYEHGTQESLHFPSDPQLRSLDMQPLARRDKEALVGGQNQDYVGLAHVYKLQRPYSDHRSNPACVLCHKASAVHVFFPCEHRCVCATCMVSENFCEEQHMTSSGYCICPLCADSIKRILPHEGGAEVEKYWAWVEEISPALPPGFVRSFGHSSSILQTIYVDKTEVSTEAESICRSS